MIVTRKVKPFEDVVVTLTTQEEVDTIFHITRHISGLGPRRDIINSLKSMLETYANASPPSHFYGDIELS